MWWNRYEQVDMVARYYPVQYLDPRLFSYLCNDRPYSLLQLTAQYPVAIFRDPHQVIAVVVQRMTSFRITLHLRNLHAEASPVLKTGVWNHLEDYQNSL